MEEAGLPEKGGSAFSMEFINDDELVEVTPASIRLRKANG